MFVVCFFVLVVRVLGGETGADQKRHPPEQEGEAGRAPDHELVAAAVSARGRRGQGPTGACVCCVARANVFGVLVLGMIIRRLCDFSVGRDCYIFPCK